MQNCSDEKSIWAVLEQILLKISFVLPWAQPTSGSQNKSKWAETTTHPIAFLGPIRSWNTNRNLFSPTNGREISSSVYGRTRPTQLYFFFRKMIEIFLKIFTSSQTIAEQGHQVFALTNWLTQQITHISQLLAWYIQYQCKHNNLHTYPQLLAWYIQYLLYHPWCQIVHFYIDFEGRFWFLRWLLGDFGG